MKMFVAPPPSVDTDVCSAAISHSLIIAAAECRTGIDTRARTLDTMCASLSVHVSLLTIGKRKPLKNAAGLYSAFLRALYKCTFNLFVSWMSSRTRSRIIDSRNLCVICGFDDTKILVAS